MPSSSSEPKGSCRTARLAILLIIVGGLAALDHACEMSIVGRIWPLLITMLGTGFLGIYAQRGRRETALLGMGVYLLCFSLLAFYCSFTSWNKITFLWPLFIAFLGVMFLAIYGFHRHRRYALLLGCVFLAIAGEFGILLSLGGQFWWSAPLFLGISLLIADKYHGT